MMSDGAALAGTSPAVITRDLLPMQLSMTVAAKAEFGQIFPG